MKKIGVVILAGGYGTCRSVGGSPFPKVVEEIDGVPMICRVVRLAPEAMFSPRIIVVNPIYEELTRSALASAGLNDCLFVAQDRRSGAGEAVRLAVPALRESDVDDFLAVYGDMPLWKPETLSRLVETHREESPVLSMATVRRHSGYPVFDHYGRVLRNRDGSSICGVVEPDDATEEELLEQVVNPSLWVWSLSWFARHIEEVPFYKSKDGLGQERFLPPLVEIAHESGERIVEVTIDDPREAIGVNTLEDLEYVQRMINSF